MKKTICIILSVISIFTFNFSINVYALEQDDIFENDYKVNDMYVMEGQTFYVYNYDKLAMVYSSSNEDIVKNDGDGKFEALQKGSSTITLSVGKSSKSFIVTVCEAEKSVAVDEKQSEIKYYGIKDVFGEDKVTLLTGDDELYLVGKSGKTYIASDVASYIRSENRTDWNSLIILKKDGTVVKWTFNSLSKKYSVDTVFAFTPKQICENYVMSSTGNVYETANMTRVCINAEKITDYGFVLLNDGTVIDIKKDGKKVTTDAKDIDINNPAVLKTDGALFVYEYNEETENYKAKLTDSSVTGFFDNLSVYKKENSAKYYNGEKTVILFDFCPVVCEMHDNVYIAVNSENEVFVNDGGIYGADEKIGDNFKSFYYENGVFAYTDTDGIVHKVNGDTFKNYGENINTNHSVDENGVMYASFGSQTVKVMESVSSLVNDPADGNGTFILRYDGTVWYCDNQTWYPRKQSESTTFYPSLFVCEYKLGDVDENGKINVKDARLTLRYSAKLEELSPAQLRAADFDENGKVNIKDARTLLRYSAGLEILEYIE